MTPASARKRSERALAGVHDDLARVVRRAMDLAPGRFVVTEGVRSLGRQRELVRAGASRTMASRHLTGHAVDLAALVDLDQDGDLEVRWDWPLYEGLAEVMRRAALEVDVPVEWGGDWTSFKDGPHFQLPSQQYPT